MCRKKILVFIDWFLPGYKAGGPIRSCANLMEHLKDEYEFSVVTRNTDYCETTPYPGIKNNQWSMLPNGIRVRYLSSHELSIFSLKKIIEKEEFELAYLNGIYSYWFTLVPLWLLKNKNKKVLVAVRGMLAESAIRQKPLKKRSFLFAAKMFGYFNGVVFQATNTEEINSVKKYFGADAIVKFAPNLPRKHRCENKIIATKEKGAVRLVNIARIAPEKNLTYALTILLSVKSRVTFDFYGPVYNQKYWNECRRMLTLLPENVKANYCGSIESHRIPEVLSAYHFLFMPSAGENFGHIILESLCCGCPVIISDQTPWKNISAENAGWALPLSCNEKFSEIIERCAAMDYEEYKIYSHFAVKYAMKFIKDEEKIKQNRLLFSS